MSDEPRYKVTLRESRNEAKLSLSLLEAYLDAAGDLVLEGYDIGELAKKVWGDSDYEYWLKVKAEDVPKVLLLLIKERFDSHTAFQEWLDGHETASDFSSWV